jgi:carbon-monoxide dehydrogenase medium subunit
MFDYHEPTTVEEAVALLSSAEDARCLAGGLTLVAMMNFGVLRPSKVVALRRIEELHGVRADPSGGVRIGAMTPHRVLATDGRLTGANEVVREAAASIGVQIRNVATIGGAVCHADPASDVNTALVAADAVVEIVGPKGRRDVAIEDFFSFYLTTVLAADEMVIAIRLPSPAPGSFGAHDKVCRVHGDTPTILATATLAFEGERIARARLAVGACGPVTLRDAEADAVLVGSRGNDRAIDEACAILAAKSDPPNDVRGSAEYRKLLIPRVVRRVVHKALEKRKATS